jgi:hypothetical protein
MNPQAIYGLIILTAFVCLCVYIAWHCVSVHTAYTRK